MESFEKRARALVEKMTIQERALQMIYDAPAVERLGIPAYNWWNECLHGVARAGVATSFPQAIAMAATFDEELVHKIACAISDEARAKHHELSARGDRGIYKGLTFWSPNINLFRDPRWGRGHETYGEDPYLTARMGVRFIRGLQGDDPKYLKLVATAKHFAVHSGPESERHCFDAVCSKKDLYESYLPAFRAAVQKGRVHSVMGAYNRTNGEPCCGSKTLLQGILRDEWGFEGYVVSDCWAVKDFHMHHHVTHTAPESAAMAVKNGCDLCCGNTYYHLMTALSEGLITEEEITRACERLMLARFKLGMFDKDAPFSGVSPEVVECGAHRDLAVEAARKSIVLLKNNGVLPLKNVRKLAVIGPNANNRDVLLANYNGVPSYFATPLDALRAKAPEGMEIRYALGCEISASSTEPLALPGDRMAEAAALCRRSDAVVLCLGLSAQMEGEEGDAGTGDKTTLDLPVVQQKLLEKILAAGKPVILVVVSGSATNLTRAYARCDALLQCFYPGAEGGLALADILLGNCSPSGRLPVTFYRSAGDLPDIREYAMKNRTYRYFTGEPLFPFGYGLSYARFTYSGLSVPRELPVGAPLSVGVVVKNISDIDGEEVVEVCLSRNELPDQPLLHLSAFGRVSLKAGEEKRVLFAVDPEQLGQFDEEGALRMLPGEVRVFVGGGLPGALTRELTGNDVLSAVCAIKE